MLLKDIRYKNKEEAGDSYVYVGDIQHENRTYEFLFEVKVSVISDKKYISIQIRPRDQWIALSSNQDVKVIAGMMDKIKAYHRTTTNKNHS